jgi:hypothetical protein
MTGARRSQILEHPATPSSIEETGGSSSLRATKTDSVPPTIALYDDREGLTEP